MKVQVFLQSEFLRDIEVVEIEAGAGHKVLRDLCIAKLGLRGEEELFLFVEDRDDDPSSGELHEIPDGLRVHLHRHKEIDVTVRYGGREVRRSFRPSSTIARVKQWSTRELEISPSDAAELMLQIAGTTNRPDADVHIGALVKAPTRSVSFDLVPSPRVNG